MKKLLLAGVGVFALSAAAPATAADLPASYPVKAPAMVAVYNWTGFYIGAHAGYGWANNSACATVVGNAFVVGTACATGGDMDGFLGGGQVGFNYQMGQFVVGVEVDLTATDQGYTVTGACGVGCTATFSQNIDWFGTARVRAGLAADRWLFYVTGGLAWQDFGSSLTTTVAGIGTFGASGGETDWGWTIGAGVEFAAWGNFTIGLEYLYIDTDTGNSGTIAIPAAVGGGTVTLNDRVENNVVRAKLNYRF